MIEKFPNDLITPQLDIPLPQIHERFFHPSHVDGFARRIKKIESAFRNLRNDLENVKTHLKGELSYKGNFYYEFMLDSSYSNSSSGITPEHVVQVKQLVTSATALRLSILQANFYAKMYVSADHLIHQNWENIIADFKNFIPANALTPNELLMNKEALSKIVYSPINLIIRPVLPHAIMIFYDSSDANCIFSTKTPDGAIIPLTIYTAGECIEVDPIALSKHIPPFLKHIDYNSTKIDQLLTILKTIAASKEYQTAIRIEWDFYDLGNDVYPLQEVMANYFNSRENENPWEVNDIIKFVEDKLTAANLVVWYGKEGALKNHTPEHTPYSQCSII